MTVRESVLENALRELLVTLRAELPVEHQYEVRHALNRANRVLIGKMESEMQALCGEALDCGMAAADPAGYMVAADQKLERDREWAKAEVRNEIAAEAVNFMKHPPDCRIWLPGAPECTCGFHAWLAVGNVVRRVTAAEVSRMTSW